MKVEEHVKSFAYLQGEVVLQGICASDGIAQPWPTHGHPAAVLGRILHSNRMLRKARKPQTCSDSQQPLKII